MEAATSITQKIPSPRRCLPSERLDGEPKTGTSGHTMTGMAARKFESSGRTAMTKPRRTKKSGYQPPSAPREVMLSEALRGTGRFPETKQPDLLKLGTEDDGRADTSLFYAGDLSLLQRPCVAIVGTRNVSEAGARRTRRLARELAEAGVVVVSGLAKGVDAIAHTTAIESGGRTIGVIGTPLDKAYPAENAQLQETIYRDHLLVSQFAPGTRTFRASFPQRNKLMATLTDATVVMEASDTSGTLHQAAECARLERWLFIAKSVADDPSLEWPKTFLKYDTCVPLIDASDITSRILKSCH